MAKRGKKWESLQGMNLTGNSNVAFNWQKMLHNEPIRSFPSPFYQKENRKGVVCIYCNISSVEEFQRWWVLKTLFSSFNFWTTLISKIMPIFWQAVIHQRNFFIFFPSSMLILGQNSCFLAPTIFEIPQPNWY